MEKYYMPEWTPDADWASEYSMLKGPNGFQCCLTEPEDRSWYRDGYKVIAELNRLADENELLKARRPSALYRPALSIDGNKWCALYGDNLQDGVAGFGDSPEEAMAAFDSAWNEKLSSGKGEMKDGHRGSQKEN